MDTNTSIIRSDHNNGTFVKVIDLYEHARQRALSSRATKPDPATLEALEQRGEAVQRESFRDAYDPNSNPNDARREAEAQEWQRERTDAKEGLALANADLRDENDRLGQTPAAGSKPTFSKRLFWLLSGVIGSSLMSTLYDRFFSDLEAAGRFLAFAFGTAVGAALAWTIVHRDPHGERAWWSYLGLGGGVVVSVAFGIARFCAAETSAEQWFALSLMLLELGIIALLEGQAMYLARRLRDWWPRSEAEQIATRRRDSAQKEVDRIKGIVDVLEAKICEHFKYVESRTPRFRSLDEAIAAAVKAVRDGYYAGIAENRGYLAGAARRSK